MKNFKNSKAILALYTLIFSLVALSPKAYAVVDENWERPIAKADMALQHADGVFESMAYESLTVTLGSKSQDAELTMMIVEALCSPLKDDLCIHEFLIQDIDADPALSELGIQDVIVATDRARYTDTLNAYLVRYLDGSWHLTLHLVEEAEHSTQGESILMAFGYSEPVYTIMGVGTIPSAPHLSSSEYLIQALGAHRTQPVFFAH